MSDPQKYERDYSFTDYQAGNPSAPLPGVQVDNELENVEQSIDEIVDAIKDVRRSDGKLQNEIVTLDSLDPTVAAGVGAGALASAQAAAASADAASDSAVAAAASATAASGSATAASGYASSALSSRNEAETQKTLAQTARTGAQTARDYASKWATEAEGVDVDDGVNPVGKSAYHWAQVALDAAEGAIADGSVTTAKLADGALSADATGRAKMADGFNTTAKLVDGILSADTTGRAKMADGFVNTAKLANSVLSADTTGRAKMADGFVTSAKIGANEVTPDKQAGEHFRGLINGLTLSNNGTDATNDIDIAAGSAGSDGTTPVLMTLATALTKRLDAAWAVGNNNGGWLDGASMPNGTGHAFLIQRSDTGVVDVGFSASLSPTLPTNYDRKAYIAPVVRASGAILPFTQTGRDTFVMGFGHVQATETISTSGATTTLANCPTGIRVLAEFSATAFSSSANIPIWLSSLLAADDTVAAGTRSSLVTPGSTAWTAGQFRLVTNTSGQIRKRAGASVSNFVTTFTGFTLLR